MEQQPIAPGCDSLGNATQSSYRSCMERHIINHIGSNFRYPQNARKLGVEARVSVTFVIERDGKIVEAEMMRSALSEYEGGEKKEKKAAKALDDEALRVIKSLRFDEPARQRGKPVRMSYTIPINIHL